MDNDLKSSVLYRIVGIGTDPKSFLSMIQFDDDPDNKRFETFTDVCMRLDFVDRLRKIPINSSSGFERRAILNQIEKLSMYITTICIDALTNEGYEPYHEWLQKAYRSGNLGVRWSQAITNMRSAKTDQEAGELFVKWTSQFHQKEYRDGMSLRKAFRNFVCCTHDWLKRWLSDLYVIEKTNFSLQPQSTKWTEISCDDKCKRIADYLYDLRNLYTHGASPYNPLNSVQRSLPNQGVTGYVGTLFHFSPSDKKLISVALPSDVLESDVIRLLIVVWIRKNWLKIEDEECIIEKYWRSRKPSTV